MAETEQKKRLGPFLKKVAVLATAALVACLIAEAAVLLLLGEQVKFPRHVVGSDFGLRINQPNSSYRHKSADVTVRFRINARGLRADEDYPYEKPPGTLRIVSLGDSFTVGYEVDVEECFSSVLEQELQAKGYSVEVLNAGVSGYSNAEECLYLERELFKYDPDLVLVSYYHNDLDDNLRSNLFGLRDGQLVELDSSYVPLGRLANFLNTNAIFSFFSAYSNAFAWIKEMTRTRLKKSMVETNVEGFEGQEPRVDEDYRQRLAGAVFQRIHEDCQERGIPLVIQVIPYLQGLSNEEGPSRLTDSFPYDRFDAEQDGVSLVPAKAFLEPLWGKQQIYWHRSHRHWTPISHELSGRALSEHIDSNDLLDRSRQTTESNSDDD